jgi:hypothetical protein
MTFRLATRRSMSVALLSVAVTAAIVIAGVWVAGGVLSNDFRTSMALTTAWFGLSGAACLFLARRFRAIRVAVLAAYVLTAGVVGAYLGLTTLRDRVVDDSVVAGTPSAVEVASARFRSHEHRTTGTAAVVRVAGGRRFLTLTSFATSPGPDLRVRLTPGGGIDGGAGGAVDLGALKGNRGDQQYAIPDGVGIAGRTVLIWCRAFSAPFGSARLPVAR